MCAVKRKGKKNGLGELKQHNEKDTELSPTFKLHCWKCRLFNNALLNVFVTMQATFSAF